MSGAGSPRNPDGRPRWIALLIILPLFFIAGLIFATGTRFEASQESPAGFDIQSTTTTVGFTGDLSAGWSDARLGVSGRFVRLAVTSDGLLAVEQTPDGSRIWASAEGATWSLITEMQLERAWIDDVIPVDGKLVAVGKRSSDEAPSRPAAWVSTDGATWDESSSVPTHEFQTGFGTDVGGSMNSVVRTSTGRLVAGGVVGRGAAVWYSVDGGRSWELAFRDPVVSEVLDVVEVPDGLLAVGHRIYEPCTWRSVDGINWERDDPPSLTAPERWEFPWQLLTLDSEWMAVGGDRQGEGPEFEFDRPEHPPVLWASTDGETWTRDLIDELSKVRFTALATGGPGLVAAGFELIEGARRPGVWWSADGREWEGNRLGEATGGSVEDLVWMDDRIVAVGQIDFGPAVWVWNADRTVEISGPSVDEFLEGVWVDRGMISSTPIWSPQRLGDAFIAFGEDTVWRSSDGRSWSSRSLDEIGITDVMWVGEVISRAGGPPYYLSGWSEGDRWALFESDDGLEWSEFYRDDAAAAGGVLAVNGDRLLRISSWDWQMEGGSVSVSDDGVTWFELEPPEQDLVLADAVGWDSDFFVLSGANWGQSGSVWRLDSENTWEPLGDSGVIEPWSLEIVALDEGTRLLVSSGQGLSLYSEAGLWRSVDAPFSLGFDGYFNVQALHHGMLGSTYQWSEDFSWPARMWYSSDGVEWMELPPLPALSTWGSMPIAGFDGLAMFNVSPDGTRLWEWQGVDSRSRIGSA